jgi:hypothetical protein
MEVYGDIRLKFNINEEQQYEIAEKFIRNVFNYPERCFIDDKGNLVETWEGGGSHSYTEEKILRKATKKDKLYIEFGNMLYEAYRKKSK